MPTALKHTECPACGHRHNFCFLGPVLIPGREYHYICPEIGKKATLRPAGKGEVVKATPQGAVALDESPPQGGVTDRRDPKTAGKTPMQDVLPEIKDLAMKVGGIDQLDEVVKNVKEMNK